MLLFATTLIVASSGAFYGVMVIPGTKSISGTFVTDTSLVVKCQFSHGESCLTCDSDTVCTSCTPGHYRNSSLLGDRVNCAECSLSLSDLCLECSDKNNCTKCIDGYSPMNGKCGKCANVPHCKTCAGKYCSSCFDSFFL